MANKRRGEIDAILDGRSYTLCLTLGALAELEQAFDANDILSLAERFERGRISAGEALKILAAGLKGGGYTLTIDEIAEMRADGGAAGYVRIVAELLAATFGSDGGPTHHHQAKEAEPSVRPRLAREAPSSPPAPPFPGAR